MKKSTNYMILIYLIVQYVPFAYAYGSEVSDNIVSDRIDMYIQTKVDLLNEIIRNPKAASTNMLGKLGNPHDETELLFYMNSISDGTLSAYDNDSVTFKELIRHSREKSTNEYSVLLRYLRLTLLAYNSRPSSNPPIIKIKKIEFEKSGLFRVIVECDYVVNNEIGRSISLPAKLFFEKDLPLRDRKEVQQSDLYLQKIIIGDRVVYGWWYD